MLLKKLIIFCLVCCTVSSSAEIVLQSGVKYNFSKTPFGSSSKGDLTWGDEANALNVKSSVFQEISVSSRVVASMISQQQKLGVHSNEFYKREEYSSSNFTNSIAINHTSSSISSRIVSVSLDDNVQFMPFDNVVLPKALPTDPDDPGIILPPETPIGDGSCFLLLLSIFYMLIKFRK